VSSVDDLSVRAAGYGMPGYSVDGMDVVAVYHAAKEAADKARAGGGPSFIVNRTYRFMGHSRGDPNYGPYRTKEEWESWKVRDPLILAAQRLGLSEADQQACLEEARNEMNVAAEFGLNSPFPDVSTAYTDIYI
jgi:pyruvate dehydrogenase E1 component alpha subunit